MYFADAMCSWCYAFGPQVRQLRVALEDRVNWMLIMGGLRPQNEQSMPELKDYLTGHWQEIEKRTGQPFNYEVMDDTTFLYDTDPAARAVVTVQKIAPDQDFDYFLTIQTAFYAVNRRITDREVLADIAAENGIDRSAFLDHFDTDEIREATEAHYQYTARLGVRGFPSLVWQNFEEYVLLSHGYEPAQSILERLEKIEAEVEE